VLEIALDGFFDIRQTKYWSEARHILLVCRPQVVFLTPILPDADPFVALDEIQRATPRAWVFFLFGSERQFLRVPACHTWPVGVCPREASPHEVRRYLVQSGAFANVSHHTLVMTEDLLASSDAAAPLVLSQLGRELSAE
jgi:hypothetical protein